MEHLFDEGRDGHNGHAIFGHSAGGQFMQRMALFRPDNRA
jgi:pimeloyl-ACP methyl ester carboxylesterase